MVAQLFLVQLVEVRILAGLLNKFPEKTTLSFVL
jgi:hypothetical protein